MIAHETSVEKATMTFKKLLPINQFGSKQFEIMFTFSKEWAGLNIIALFSGDIRIPVLNNTCFIPPQMGSTFEYSLIGLNGNDEAVMWTLNPISDKVVSTIASGSVPPENEWALYIDEVTRLLNESKKYAGISIDESTKSKTSADNAQLSEQNSKEYRDGTQEIYDDFVITSDARLNEYNTNATNKLNEYNDNADNANIVMDEKVLEATEQANNSKTSADNAKLSENNSKTSENKSNQALSDLLAMLGTDVATLTNGKLTSSQIPDLSINKSFLIANESELTSLTAQVGDMAYKEADGEVTALYWLVGNDSTVSANWKQLGLSFVANAGHANTADNANNANMINNKRIVSMTEQQYEQAVKDTSVYYFVSGV